MVDLPGTYSPSGPLPEEKVARDYIASGQASAVVVVCDAGCLSVILFWPYKCWS